MALLGAIIGPKEGGPTRPIASCRIGREDDAPSHHPGDLTAVVGSWKSLAIRHAPKSLQLRATVGATGHQSRWAGGVAARAVGGWIVGFGQSRAAGLVNQTSSPFETHWLTTLVES
jgi:hypothetical protein